MQLSFSLLSSGKGICHNENCCSNLPSTRGSYSIPWTTVVNTCLSSRSCSWATGKPDFTFTSDKLPNQLIDWSHTSHYTTRTAVQYYSASCEDNKSSKNSSVKRICRLSSQDSQLLQELTLHLHHQSSRRTLLNSFSFTAWKNDWQGRRLYPS